MKSGTTEHPKFKFLKASLGVPDYIAVGILESLWMVAAKWKEHGGIGEWTDGMIASAIGWDGDAQKLIAALVDCGWLDRHETYRLMIHDWFDHCPEYMHDRIVKREQRRKKRDSVHGQSEDSPRTVCGQSENVLESLGKSLPTLSNPTLSNPTLSNPTLSNPTRPMRVSDLADSEIPDELNTPEFIEAWAGWVKYRRETKKKLAPSTAAKQLSKLATVGADAAIAAINRSIEHGWAGLFPETQPAKSQPNNSQALPEAQGWTLEEIQQVEAGNAN